MQKRTIRLFSWILALAMILSLIPAGFAAGSYEKATSIAVGDTVLLVYEADSMEFSGISDTSTKYGIGVAYTGSPAGAAPLRVVAGASEGTYAFELGEAYLCWSNGNSLKTTNKLDASTSWNVSFDNEGNVTITNASAPDRSLQWNASYTRFACYTSSQKAIQLYKLTSGSGGDPEKPTEPTQPTETEPTQPSEPDPDDTAGEYVIAALIDGTYYAMTNTFGKKVESKEITVADGKVSKEVADAYTVTLTKTEGGYTISAGGKYLAYGSSTDLKSSADPYVWKVSAGSKGSYIFSASTDETRGLVFRAGTTNKFGGYAVSNLEKAGEYYGLEVLSIEGSTAGEFEGGNNNGNNNGDDNGNNNGNEYTVFDPNTTYYVIAAKIGETYYAMSNTFTEKDYEEITVLDGKVKGEDASYCAVALTEVEGGWTVFCNKKYMAYKSDTNRGNSDDPYVWIRSKGTNGSWRFAASTEPKRGLAFRAGNYYTFGTYVLSNVEETPSEYYDVEILEVEGRIPDPLARASAPKASPEKGYVYKGTEVTLSASKATVVYHLGDGNWTTYTEPFVINEEMTITAKSQAPGKRDSKEVVLVYKPYVVGEDKAVLVTDMSQLASGDRIIIVAKNNTNTLGVVQNAKSRGVGNVVKEGDTCRYDVATQILTLESGTSENTYAFYTGDGYLFAPWEDDNALRTQADKTEIGSFFITIAEDGTATIVADTLKENKVLLSNSSDERFSCYKDSSDQKKLVCIYKLEGQERPGLPEDGDTVVLYNLAVRGVLSSPQGKSLRVADATLFKGMADCGNGAFLFKVEKSGESYRFYNESFGYLCSEEDTLSYSFVGDTEADWTVEAYNGGYRLLSADGNFLLGQTGAVKPGEEIADRDTATYYFYPCNSEGITDGVVNKPWISFGNPSPAYAGRDYILNFSVDAIFGIKEMEVSIDGTKLEYRQSYGRYAVTIPADMIAGTTLNIRVKATDNKGVMMESTASITVKDEPMFSELKPIANSQTKENKRPEITAKVTNAGEAPTVTLTINGEAVTPTYKDGLVSYKPTADLAEGRTVVILTVTRRDGKSATKKWSFTVGEAKYTMLFGQLHAHTGEYSDGAGTLAGALEYIDSIPEEANVDFVAFTDHSHYFDTAAAPNVEDSLYDLSLASAESAEKWTTYKSVLSDYNKTHQGKTVLIPGFEMTWSGGPGHINTFVTEGIVSRNNKTLDDKRADAGLRAYYELIGREEGEDSINQLNHPGTTFGNFINFSYLTPEVDAHVYLVEVGNGDGPIRGAGYYPSYEEYTLALDKGWHVAPTNNQDNHKGKWGNANEARDVVLVEEFTEEGIYDAIRNYRVYATEDRNLEIGYTVNELPMGTMMENIPETLNFGITLKDPDAEDTITSVELIVNSGKVAYAWTDAEELASGVLSVELEPEYSYYYVRVIQGDKDIAVTAPVWVGDSLRLGIREATANADIAVVGEKLEIQTTFYNEEAADAIVKNIVYTMNGSQVLSVDNEVHVLSAGSVITVPFAYTPEVAKRTNITITATVEYDGKEFTFATTVDLNVVKEEEIGYLVIDGSHENEYVSGSYQRKLENFTVLAQEANIRVTTAKYSENLIAACKNEKVDAILLIVPSRVEKQQVKTYSQEELTALREFNEGGGILIIANWADTFDQQEPSMAATQNALLEALGSSLRFADDSARTKGKTSTSIYSSAYGEDELTVGLSDAVQCYNSSTIYAVNEKGEILNTLPKTVSGILYGNSDTYSKDEDGDGFGIAQVPKYTYGSSSRLLLMAAERVEGKGMIFVTGVPFMNDYNVVFPEENGNNALAKNLLNAVNPVVITDIAEVRAQTEVGYKYTIEGVVTSNGSGYDRDTAFFDCIYVQDETAGINCFPVAGDFKIGDVVRVVGLTEYYIGEPELQVQTIQEIGETTPVVPMEITASQLNDRSVEGSLVTLKGYVVNYTVANGLIESIYVVDGEGVVARAFVDGYITAGNEIKNMEIGRAISVTGLASYDDSYVADHGSFARIRVRDRREVITSDHTHTLAVLEAVKPTCTATGLTAGEYCTVCTVITVPQEVLPAAGHTMANGTCSVCGYEKPAIPFTDVPENRWYREAVEYVYYNKLMNGTKTDIFAPERTLTRAMLVTILYRMAGEPEVTIDNPFADVPAGQWYTKAVLWGYENNIVKGLKADKFGPDNDVTREQMVTFLYRYAAYAGYDVSYKADMSAYKDAATVSSYAVEPFAWAIGAGIVNGVTKDTLKPLGTATRAQVAKVIMVLDCLEK